MGSPDILFGLDFERIKKQHEDGHTAFVSEMERWRALPTPQTREEAAAGFLRSQRIIATEEDIQAIAEALDAAYGYKCWLASQSSAYDHSAERHRGDWIDLQLLYYLADPNMHIVTNDQQLKKRCATSPLAERIIVV